MNVLELLGILFILAVAFVVVCVFANWFCNPVMATTTTARFANRAKRQVEQGLFTLLYGIILAGIVVVFYFFVPY